jgi:methylmalonyl-CoA/ethylmalonyl-CoA epimerase
MKIHHVGIACDNVEESVEEFSNYHTILKQSKIVFDELQNAHLCLLNTDTGLDVEFISGPQVQRLVKKGVGFYHVCYEVDDLEATISTYLSKGAMLISEPKPAILFENRLVAFVRTSYGLVELLQAK